MEEIVYVENMVNLVTCKPNMMRGRGDIGALVVESVGSCDSSSSAKSMIFESIGGISESMSSSSSSDELGEDFDQYFEIRCNTRNQCVRNLISSENTRPEMETEVLHVPVWRNVPLHQYSVGGDYDAGIGSTGKNMT